MPLRMWATLTVTDAVPGHFRRRTAAKMNAVRCNDGLETRRSGISLTKGDRTYQAKSSSRSEILKSTSKEVRDQVSSVATLQVGCL